MTAHPPEPSPLTDAERAHNLSEPAAYSGLAPDLSREVEVAAAGGLALARFREVLLDTGEARWADKTLAGLSQKMLWRNDETGASIALVRFARGAGIPQPHSHAANQFMFCLSGRYTYVPTGLTLTAGSFYWNPKGSLHGPTHAEQDTVLLEMYDGPHYPTQPSWYTNLDDAS